LRRKEKSDVDFSVVFRLLCVLAMVLLLPAAARGQGVEWIRQFGSPDQDAAAGVAADTDGNVYVAGDTVDALPGQTETGSHDAYVRKYDSQGNEIWTQQFGLNDGAAQVVQGRGVAVGPDGRVYVAGNTSGTFPGEVNFGRQDGFLRKYDPDGTEIWTRQFGSDRYEWVDGAAVSSDGAVYVVGVTSGALPGQTRVGGDDVFIGNLIWIRQFGTALFDEARAVGVDPDGNAYVVGVLEESGGWGDIFLRKYDPAGAEIWTRRFCAPDSCWASAVAVDADGNPHVVGGVRGTLPGQTRTGWEDAFLRKYDPDGTELWTRQFGTAPSAQAGGVAVDMFGDVWVGGTARGAFPGQTSAGGGDIFLRKYDAAGDELWTCQFGSPDDDYGPRVAVGPDGSPYLCGQTRGELPGQTYLGDQDAFLLKLLRCGVAPAAVALPAKVCLGGDVVLDASATTGQPCAPAVIEYAWTDDPVPPPPAATCGPVQVLDCWDEGNATLTLTGLSPPPGERIVTRWLWVRPRGEWDCANEEPYPVTFEVHRPPEMGSATATDEDPCATGVAVAWVAAVFHHDPLLGPGTFNIYRTESTGDVAADCAATLATGNLVGSDVAGTAFLDTTTSANTEYVYVIEAEDREPGNPCEPAGPVRGGATSSVCVAAAGGPVLDEVDETVPSAVEISMEKIQPEGLRFWWAAVPEGDSYRVARGDLGDWYSHATDEAVGRGVCDTQGALIWEDPVGLSRNGSFYYLAVPLSRCGTEGPWGAASDGTRRPGRISTPACP